MNPGFDYNILGNFFIFLQYYGNQNIFSFILRYWHFFHIYNFMVYGNTSAVIA